MEAEAGLQAAGPEGTGGATFVAEEPGPARVADALPKQWVAAGGVPAQHPSAPSMGHWVCWEGALQMGGGHKAPAPGGV